MDYSWSCPQCTFAVWSSTEEAAREEIRSHLVDHNRGSLYREEYRIGWDCPYCGANALEHSEEEAVWSFKRHLFDHVEQPLRSGTSVTDAVELSGNALVEASPDGAGADNARLRFVDAADVTILVTPTAGDRLRSMADSGSSWPDRTIVVTAKQQPLSSVGDLDLQDVPIEVVQLDPDIELIGFGETISRVIAEHNAPKTDVFVTFDILPELLAEGDLETLFKFLHLLTARIENAGAFSHFYCPSETTGPAMNLLSELFDRRISATDDRLVLEP